MAKPQPKIVNQETAVIIKAGSHLIYCSNCHDYMFHRKINNYPDRSIYQCHICGTRVKLIKQNSTKNHPKIARLNRL